VDSALPAVEYIAAFDQRRESQRDWRECLGYHAADTATLTAALLHRVREVDAGIYSRQSVLLGRWRVTVHYNYARAFTAAYPAVPVHPERVLIISGVREELVSSGASTTWHDMVLYREAALGILEAQPLAPGTYRTRFRVPEFARFVSSSQPG
jgi:hypothetical protein